MAGFILYSSYYLQIHLKENQQYTGPSALSGVPIMFVAKGVNDKPVSFFSSMLYNFLAL